MLHIPKSLAFCLFLLCSLLLSQNAFGQKDTATTGQDIMDMSLEELMNVKVFVASRKPLLLNEAPSIITIITAEEIGKSGARDLMDILKLIPGVEFNVDVQGAVGISIRGIWANEGKVLLRVDGQEMNENAYGTIQFGNRYNISQIKKIEVIGGPGSAIYGGFAEYAVINIITNTDEDVKGINANVIMGQTSNTYARQNASLFVANKINQFNYSVSAFLGRGQRSNHKYTDLSDSSYSMIGNSKLNPASINVAMAYKKIALRFIYDQLATNTRDGFGTNYYKAHDQNFTDYLAELKYSTKISNKMELRTMINYKYSMPWHSKDKPVNALDSSNYAPYIITTERYRANVAAIWDPNSNIDVVVGGEVYYDKAKKPDDQIFRNDNVHNVSYFNYAPYVQALFKTQFANITLGARYDMNSSFGGAFNPRIGITKKLGIVNFKLLYGSSYRAPVIENIQTSFGKIKPEQSNTFEFETAINLNKNMFLSVSLYDITTKNSIQYFVSSDTAIVGLPEGYKNVGKSGSQGIGLEYKYKSALGFITANYSYYTVGNKNLDSANRISLNRNSSLGIANHKFTILASLNIGKYIYLSPSVNFIGNRYGYSSVDSLRNGVISLYKPKTQFNLYAGTQNLTNGLSFGIGVYNLTDERIEYLQAYNSLHAPYPGMGRELVVKLSYTFNFKNSAKESKTAN